MRTLLAAVFLSLFIPGAMHADDQIRFRLDVDAFGNCTVSVGPADGEPGKSGGEGVEQYHSKRLPKTTINKTKGLVRLVHDFSDADPLEKLTTTAFGESRGVKIDERFSVLSLASRPGQEATFAYAYRVGPPLAIGFDRQPFDGESEVQTQVGFGGGSEILSVNLYTSKQASDKNLIVHATWIDFKKNQRTKLMEPFEFSSDATIKKEFRLPLPNAEIETKCFLLLKATSGDRSLHELSSLTVQGKVSPLFGIGLDERRDTVFAKNVFDDSLADQAGLETGDVIVSINGERPENAQDANESLGDTEFGKEAIIEVMRAGKPLTITMLCE